MTEPSTDPATGLTAAEVADRVAKGQTNLVPNAPTRSVGQIVRGNVLTPINLIVAILAALVIIAGSPKDALFGGVIVANSVIGVVQELRAKKVLDQLSVVNAPRARVVRDGKVIELQVHELVLDDVVELRAGAQVVADGDGADAREPGDRRVAADRRSRPGREGRRRRGAQRQRRGGGHRSRASSPRSAPRTTRRSWPRRRDGSRWSTRRCATTSTASSSGSAT